MLRFVLLGPFRAERDGVAIPAEEWRSRQTRTVLKMLVDARDRTVPFDRLVDTVWPGAEGDSGRNSLQAAIRTLRRILEPGLERGDASAHIRTEADAYRFVSRDCAIDVDELRSALRRASAHDHRGENDMALSAYAQATSLYGGEYLADEPYADWALGPREQLRSSYLDAVARLASLLEREGRVEQMVIQLERGLAADRLREDLYRLLMRAHALAGRRAHALSVFDRCRRALRAELGVEPSAETRRERERIASGERATAVAEGTPAPETSQAPPFVGRERELALLRQAWARATAGRGSLVLITGEAGIGKSRLVRHFLEQLAPQTQILAGSAYESDTLSYAVAARLVESKLERLVGLRHVQTLGPSAGVLASIVPAVRTAWPDCPASPAGASDPAQALEAITQALLADPGRGPSVISIDDAHWLDDASARWIAYALHRDTNVLAIVTARSGERVPPTLDALRTDLARDERLVRVDLGPLTTGDVARLMSATPEDSAGSAERLHSAAGGNPLFVIQLLRSGGASGEGPLPATIREAVVARLRRCDDAERATLALLAVLGDPARADLVASVAERPLASTLEALEALLARRLVRAHDDGRYEIEHPLIQRVVYDEIVPGRRHDLHRRAARVLGEPGRRESARSQLRHLLASDADPSEIARTAERAGDEAMASHRHGDAVEGYALAADKADRSAGMDGAGSMRARVLERRGEALHAMGRSQEAVAAYDELIDAARDPLDLARLLRKTAQFLGQASMSEALARLDRAERELGSRGDDEARAERGRIEGVRAVPLFYRSDFRAAIAAGERALTLLAGVPHVDQVLGDIDIRMGAAYQRLGDLESATAAFRRMRARARVNGDVVMESRADGALAMAAHNRGLLREALALSEATAADYERCALPRYLTDALINRGYLLTDLGDLRAARAAYLEALRHATAIGSAYHVMHITVGLGGVELRLGLRSARRTLERGIELADGLGNRQRKAHAFVYLAELALLDDDAAHARDHARTAIEQGDAIDDSHSRREGGAVLAAALLALGDAAAAAAAARSGVEIARSGGFVLAEARNLVPLGQALRAAGKPAEGRRAIAEAERIFRGADARYDLAQTLLARAVEAARPGALLNEAHTLAEAAGARPLAARIAAARASSAGVQPTA